MKNTFDKLAYGVANQIHFALDLIVLLGFLGYVGNVPLGQHMVGGALAASVFAAGAAVARLYAPVTPRSVYDRIVLLAMILYATSWVYWLSIDVISPAAAQAAWPIKWFTYLLIILASLDFVLFRPFKRSMRPVEDILIVGTGHLAAQTYEKAVHGSSEVERRIVGFTYLRGEPTTMQGVAAKVLGDADHLLDILSKHPVTEIYFATKIIEHADQVQKLVTDCERIGMPFALPLHTLQFSRATLLSSSPARDGYLHYLSIRAKPLQFAIKRLIDTVASAMALLVLMPLIVVVALLIKLTSRGPILYKQERVGLHGHTFHLLKFRSMVVNAEALQQKIMTQNEQSGPVFKMKNDPRVTQIGQFIRKFSIDELPQLINILRGDMTIVGPRPALPKEVAQYKAWHRRRLSVRPGLTCYWQVSGRNHIGFDEWMRLDLLYVDNFSIWLDIALILKTIPVVLYGRGAS